VVWAAIGLVALHASNVWAKPNTTSSAEEHGSTAHASATLEERGGSPGPWVRFLTRETITGPRFLDHGVLGVGAAGGFPHRYRVELSLGVLDYVTLGITSHWLAGQSVPGWSPRVGVAFWRGHWFEAGAHYHRSLFPPPSSAAEGEEEPARQRVHWILSSVTFCQWYLAAGFDLGMAYGLEQNLEVSPDMDPLVGRARFAGGLHLRAGTRRWGFTVQALWPYTEAELVFDVRFALFEKRPRGGWRPDPAVEIQPRSQY
jgi:hypothetical protein